MTISDFIYLKFIRPETLLILKMVSLIISLLLIAGIVYCIKKSGWLKVRYGFDVEDFLHAKDTANKNTEKIWAKIQERIKRRSESEFKLAIIEADSFLDKILEKMGYQGETLGDRLQKIDSAILPSLQEIWQAHKLRNDIVHNPDFNVTIEEAEEIIRIYEKALRDLNVLS